MHFPSLNFCRSDGGLALRLDALGAFFLVLIGLGAIPAAMYGAGYTAAYNDGRASLRLLGAMLNLFLLTMSLVALADNVLTFLLMWEGMSLTSYFLVITEADEERARERGPVVHRHDARRAGVLAGGVCAVDDGGTGAFADLRAGAASLSPATRNVIFLLASSASARRRASCRFTSGCRAPIRPRRVTFPR